MRLSEALIGTWELVSREDRDPAGRLLDEPVLGADPLGLLFYDRSGRFALQLMKRGRTGAAGYDAYFGTYDIDDARGVITQTLQGALQAEQVGLTVTRRMTIEGNALLITLETTNANNEPVIRTLLWRRAA